MEINELIYLLYTELELIGEAEIERKKKPITTHKMPTHKWVKDVTANSPKRS